MPKAEILRGISCSGKSIRAKELVEAGYVEINRDYARFNVVCPGTNWGTYKMNRTNEKAVTEYCDILLVMAWEEGKDVVISDTNLNLSRLNSLTEKLHNLGYKITITDLDVKLEEAWKRDSLRENGVGHSVIYQQYMKRLKLFKGEVSSVKKGMREAIIVDIDGTIAKMTTRHPFEWHKVGEDSPRDFIIELVNKLSNKYTVIIMSGRDGVCRPETEKWLRDNKVYVDHLFMRGEGDNRPDTEIKEELYNLFVKPHYSVVAVFDDRPCMVRKWYELGVPNVMAVGNPWIEF